MKGFAFIWMVTLLISCGAYQNLQSHKQTPDWIYGLEQGYIITSGLGYTHEEAKSKAIANVKEKIVSSIAVQVISNSNFTTVEETENTFSSYMDEFSTDTDIRSEYFEAIKGISPSKVKDFYWEKVKDGKENKVQYFVKYPFSKTELNALIADFDAINNELERELDGIAKKENYTSVEDILKDIRKVDYLAGIMSNQKQRIAFNKKRQLQDMMSDIKISRVTDKKGFIEYYLSLYNKPVDTQETPNIYSSCDVKVDKVIRVGNHHQVTYNSANCDLLNPQYIEINYDFTGYVVMRRFSL